MAPTPDLHITLSGNRQLTTQIYEQLLTAIQEERLAVGDVLPPTRELAQRLSVSRGTVTAAYDRLVNEGYLSAKVGSGTTVASGPPHRRPQPAPVRTGALRPLPHWDHIDQPPVLSADQPIYDFRPGMPDAARFPYQVWRRISALHTEIGSPGGQYDDPSGYEALRAAIAQHCGVSRGLRAGPDDVVVTAGTQQAIDLLVRTLCAPGDVVAMEDPGYSVARSLFASHRLRVCPVRVDAEGLVVDALPDEAKLVYVSPSHQFPLGLVMSAQRRVELLDWALSRGAVVIEDDYDSEYRFSGRPLEPLHTLDTAGLVIYLGTFSKSLLPMLRLGFMIAPRNVLATVRKAKFLTDWHCPTSPQATLAEFIDAGYLARHVRAMRRVYSPRRELILERLDHELAHWLERQPSEAGLHITATLRDPVADDRALTIAARREGVAMQALSNFSVVSRQGPGDRLWPDPDRSGRRGSGPTAQGPGAVAPDRCARRVTGRVIGPREIPRTGSRPLPKWHLNGRVTATSPCAPLSARPVQPATVQPPITTDTPRARRERDIGLGELEAFVQVVDSGGFTPAARRLHLSQPGLSSRIIKLERKLGTVLIDRSSRRLTLTPAGRTLLPRVRTLLGQMDEAVDALAAPARHADLPVRPHAEPTRAHAR